MSADEIWVSGGNPFIGWEVSVLTGGVALDHRFNDSYAARRYAWKVAYENKLCVVGINVTGQAVHWIRRAKKEESSLVMLSDKEIVEIMRKTGSCRENDEGDHINFARAILDAVAQYKGEGK